MGARYMECSSKEMKGVEDVFETAINTVVGQELELREQDQSRSSGTNSSWKVKSKKCTIL